MRSRRTGPAGLTRAGDRGADRQYRDRAPDRARGAGDAPEVVAGRNAVLESLRARVPATALYAGPRDGSDPRFNEVIRLAADAGIPVIEAGRPELDRLTGGAVHQGLALKIRPYDYAHPGDLLQRARARGEEPLIVALDFGHRPAQPRRDRPLGRGVRGARRAGARPRGPRMSARAPGRPRPGRWPGCPSPGPPTWSARSPPTRRPACSWPAWTPGAAPTSAISAWRTARWCWWSARRGAACPGWSRSAATCWSRIPIASQTESLNAGVAAGIALYEVAARRAR